jgi:hypothetical protein
MPKSLILKAAPLLPSAPALLRSLGSAIIEPFCHRNGTQVLPLWVRACAFDPQKSSPFGSAVVVSACPTTCPQRLAPKAELFGPPSPGLPMSFVFPCFQRKACDTADCARTISPLTSPGPVIV